MTPYSKREGEWDEPVIVTINGNEYPTQLYDGVQRFIPNSLNEWLTHSGFVTGGVEPTNERRSHLLNEMIVAVHYGELEIADWIEFQLSNGLSVEGACSSISQQLGNMDLQGRYPFLVHNPNWGTETEDWNPPYNPDEDED